MVRYPSWVKEGALKILVNGKPVEIVAKPSSFVAVERNWKKGDEIQILCPCTRQLKMPNVPNCCYHARPHFAGCCKQETEDLKGLVADDGRWAHIAGGERLPVDKAPIIIEIVWMTLPGNSPLSKTNHSHLQLRSTW
ncbi:MAG: glycoside hydrolase family 127 protein [Draconibacterium sp.]|nr:glycoside hydrolase family 127 protein [Draconibacterium sp.]